MVVIFDGVFPSRSGGDAKGSGSCSHSGAVSGLLHQTEQTLAKLGTLEEVILCVDWAMWQIPLVLSIMRFKYTSEHTTKILRTLGPWQGSLDLARCLAQWNLLETLFHHKNG